MTDQHLITPPPELVQQWCDNPRLTWLERLSLAYAAGADQELEACCNWLEDPCAADMFSLAKDLRYSRRPKSSSLKEQALNQLASIQIDLNKFGMGISTDTIRCALEQLND